MSACKCSERKKLPEDRDWEVWQRNCNHSAFNGYHWTASDYSSVKCNQCGAHWRTKSSFVVRLPDKKF